MREITHQEIMAVSGGGDGLFMGMVIGGATGFVGGAAATVSYLHKHHPYISLIPGVTESALEFGAIGGLGLGIMIGSMVGFLFDDDL